MKPIEMTVNDTGPSLVITVKRSGSAIDITGATILVKGRMVGAAVNKFSNTATLTDPENGIFTHAWSAGDVDTNGDMELEVQITHSSGKVETAPARIPVTIKGEY